MFLIFETLDYITVAFLCSNGTTIIVYISTIYSLIIAKNVY